MKEKIKNRYAWLDGKKIALIIYMFASVLFNLFVVPKVLAKYKLYSASPYIIIGLLITVFLALFFVVLLPKENEHDTFGKRTIRTIKAFTPVFVAACAIGFLIKIFILAGATIPTNSMANTLNANDVVVTSKIPYMVQNIERGDIVSFYNKELKSYMSKRVIGIAGDKIVIKNGKVYLNESKEPLIETYITTGTPEGDFGPFDVPDGHVFLLGDNRNDSHDSRYWENPYISAKKVIGKTLFKLYPNIEKIK